jgi:hypothetical protein
MDEQEIRKELLELTHRLFETIYVHYARKKTKKRKDFLGQLETFFDAIKTQPEIGCLAYYPKVLGFSRSGLVRLFPPQWPDKEDDIDKCRNLVFRILLICNRIIKSKCPGAPVPYEVMRRKNTGLHILASLSTP